MKRVQFLSACFNIIRSSIFMIDHADRDWDFMDPLAMVAIFMTMVMRLTSTANRRRWRPPYYSPITHHSHGSSLASRFEPVMELSVPPSSNQPRSQCLWFFSPFSPVRILHRFFFTHSLSDHFRCERRSQSYEQSPFIENGL